MEEACSRLFCEREPVALLTFSAAEAKAWLLDLGSTDDTTSGIQLCQHHADKTAVPMSWQLIDKRDPAWPGSPKPGSVAAQLAAAVGNVGNAFAAELNTIENLDEVAVQDSDDVNLERPSLKVLPNSEIAEGDRQDSLVQTGAELVTAAAPAPAQTTNAASTQLPHRPSSALDVDDSSSALTLPPTLDPELEPIDPQLVEDQQDESDVVDAGFNADIEALSREVSALRTKVAQMSERVDGDIKADTRDTHPSSGPLMID